MKRLEGKVAVITGGANGIGAATAQAMAAEGARIVIGDLDGPGAEAMAARLCATFGDGAAVGRKANVGEPADVEALFGAAAAHMRRVDILVNSAGTARIGHFLDHTLADWELVMRINLTGTFLCGQAAARAMLRNAPASAGAGPRQRGAIINIASISGQRGGTGRAAYGASKGGVIALTKVMAVDLAAHGIRVNAIAPGPIETEMARQGHTKETREAYYRLIPQARYGDVEDIAQAAVYLAADASGYVTGHTLNVDGGFGAAGVMFDDLPAKA